MRIRSKPNQPGAIGQLAMTPMIDIVFQLLVFFILTFKVVPQEGDLNIQAAARAGAEINEMPVTPLPLQLRLSSDPAGELAGIRLNERHINSLDELQTGLIALLGDDRGPNSIQAQTSLTLSTDPGLKYAYVVDAVTAVSGYRDDGGKLIRLIEKLKVESQPSSESVF